MRVVVGSQLRSEQEEPFMIYRRKYWQQRMSLTLTGGLMQTISNQRTARHLPSTHKQTGKQLSFYSSVELFSWKDHYLWDVTVMLLQHQLTHWSTSLKGERVTNIILHWPPLCFYSLLVCVFLSNRFIQHVRNNDFINALMIGWES